MFPNVDESFGGLHIYMYGDFQQMPPVKDSHLHNKFFADPMCGQGALIFQTFVELSVIGKVRKSNFQIFSTA